MRNGQVEVLDPQITAALDELADLIRAHYAGAQFEIRRGADDPEAVHLIAMVELEDPEEVVDLVIDRLLEFQVEERLPIHVIPVRPIERVVAAQRASLSHAHAYLGNML